MTVLMQPLFDSMEFKDPICLAIDGQIHIPLVRLVDDVDVVVGSLKKRPPSVNFLLLCLIQTLQTRKIGSLVFQIACKGIYGDFVDVDFILRLRGLNSLTDLLIAQLIEQVLSSGEMIPALFVADVVFILGSLSVAFPVAIRADDEHIKTVVFSGFHALFPTLQIAGVLVGHGNGVDLVLYEQGPFASCNLIDHRDVRFP